MQIQIERIQKDIDIISTFNSTPEKGITRLTFSEPYQRAIGYVVDELKHIGATLSYCQAGNIKARLPGSDDNGSSVMMGSHLDTVVHGGRFDGVVGVVTALEAARIIVEKNLAHRLPIDVVVFAEEEGSRFNWGLLGSSIWTGKLDLSRLSKIRDTSGISYQEAMTQAGLKISDKSLLEPRNLRAMLEVHVEQGAVLEKKGFRIGLVEVIAGINHLNISISGTANHAGTTPMDDRFDALQAAARIIIAVEEIAHEIGANTVATVGRIACDPGQTNVIAGRASFSIDVRNSNKALLDSAVAAISQAVKDICGDRSLGFEISPLGAAPPVALSRKIVALMEENARQRNVETFKMVSGAGHDSAMFADVTETGMIFVPSRDGLSHCPEEFTRSEDIGLGCEILLATAIDLAA
jgi:allantoate deiminase